MLCRYTKMRYNTLDLEWTPGDMLMSADNEIRMRNGVEYYGSQRSADEIKTG